MHVARFLLLFLALMGGFAGLLFGWKAITKSDVVGTVKLIVAGGLAFALAITIFILET